MGFLTFKPIRRQIANITSDNPAVVTTVEPHGYLPGLYVRMDLPINCGMEQLSGQQFLIDDITPTMFSIGIDTRSFTPFVTGKANVLSISNTNPGIIVVDAPQFLPRQRVIVNGLTGALSDLNGTIFTIFSIQGGTSLNIGVDLTAFPAYIGPGSLNPVQSPQVIPIAEISGTLQNAEKNNLTPIGGP